MKVVKKERKFQILNYKGLSLVLKYYFKLCIDKYIIIEIKTIILYLIIS